jgi:glyoxylase-like metal-dependent hydrolase (beta-lactamase superfamily II)
LSVTVRNVTSGATEFTCNAYLIKGAVPTLVDAGAMTGVESEIARHVDELDRVVITHQHGDHVAELDAVLDAFDATLYAAAAHPRRTNALAAGDTLQVGDDTYEVVTTPGHADDHVSLVGTEAVFSGDVLVYNDGAFDDGSFGRTDLPGQSRERLIESLQTLSDRIPASATRLYAGHGDVFDAADHDEPLQSVVDRALERARRREPKYPDE